jgi:hypothetical protein
MERFLTRNGPRCPDLNYQPFHEVSTVIAQCRHAFQQKYFAGLFWEGRKRRDVTADSAGTGE